MGAIMRFQRECDLYPDGRVDPMGKTWSHLADPMLIDILHLDFEHVTVVVEEWILTLLAPQIPKPDQGVVHVYGQPTQEFTDWHHKTGGGAQAAGLPPGQIGAASASVMAAPTKLCWGARVSYEFNPDFPDECGFSCTGGPNLA